MNDKNTDERDTMIVYRSFYEAIRQLPKENQAEVWEAVFEYGLNFNELELTGISKVIFTLIKPIIEANIKRFINGKKPKLKQNASESEAKPKQDASEGEANKDVNKDKDENKEVLSPIPPSSAKPQKREKKQKEETTIEKAISHYKTETELAKQAEGAGGRAGDFENFRKLGLEICGLAPTDDCPNGMVKTIMKLPEQLTFSQYTKLVKKMGSHEALREILVAMHNKYVQYLTKSTSINLIAQDWYKNKMSGKGNGGAKPEATVAKKQQYGPIGD